MRLGSSGRSCILNILRRLEQLYRISVRVFDLDLFPNRTFFYFIAKTNAGLIQLFDPGKQVSDLKRKAI